MCVCVHVSPPSLPLPSQIDPRPGTEGTALPSTAHGSESGDNRSRGPCRALQLFTRLYPPTSGAHTLSPLNTHLGRMGRAHSSPPREERGDGDCDSSELCCAAPHLASSSPLLEATSYTCDTTDSLMPHYPYTSPSPVCVAPPPALFPDVASKLGHEHDTRGHVRGRR